MKFLFIVFSIAIFTMAGFCQEGQTASLVVVPEVAAKAEGTVRIGLMTPKLALGQEASSVENANAIREALAGYLKGPTVDVVVIDAKSATNAVIEAGQKGCDFILVTGVSKKTKTSLFGSLIKAAVPVVAGQIPGGAAVTETASGIGNVKDAVAQGGKDFVNNTVAAKFGAKDEITLDFTLATADAKSAVAKGSASAKVKADGEDVLTTLIEQVSEKVLQTVVRKQ
ncbi:MAG: hypothetical protein ABL952_17580 [Pyrinomonadaceae bacterium]